MGAALLNIDAPMSSGESESIEVLVERAKTGDVPAFEALYRRTSERVYALCLRLSGDRDLATDLLQDVFVRAWQRLHTFRGESLFATWLHRLAINVVLQQLRALRRRREREVSASDLDHFERAARQSFPGTKLDLERAIAKLPERARRVLVLRDVEGYKYAEIARMTGVAVGTVKAQVHRARTLVREALA
jgi:RNA polymerase sigma-70 factor (ECF subfamily)